MPIQWKPQEISVYKSWCDAIVQQKVKLNTFEKSFLASIMMRLDSNINLTELQAKTLENIYAEKTS